MTRQKGGGNHPGRMAGGQRDELTRRVVDQLIDGRLSSSTRGPMVLWNAALSSPGKMSGAYSSDARLQPRGRRIRLVPLFDGLTVRGFAGFRVLWR